MPKDPAIEIAATMAIVILVFNREHDSVLQLSIAQALSDLSQKAIRGLIKFCFNESPYKDLRCFYCSLQIVCVCSRKNCVR